MQRPGLLSLKESLTLPLGTSWMLVDIDLDVWQREIRAHHKAGGRRAGEQHGLLPGNKRPTMFDLQRIDIKVSCNTVEINTMTFHLQ